MVDASLSSRGMIVEKRRIRAGWGSWLRGVRRVHTAVAHRANLQ
ncbi:MAG: hypothetical protein ACK583_17290 [Cyanobacteriota bacterium]